MKDSERIWEMPVFTKFRVDWNGTTDTYVRLVGGVAKLDDDGAWSGESFNFERFDGWEGQEITILS